MIINMQNLTGIYKSFSTIFNEAYLQAASQWDLVAMEAPSAGRENTYAWLGDLPQMREWIGDRQISDLKAHDYTLKNKSYEATIEVDRDDIDDDLIGIHRPRIQMMGQQAKVHPDILIFDLLKLGFETECYDGQYFFDTDHPVGDSTVSNDGAGAGTGWYLMDLSKPIKPMILQRRKMPEFVAMDRQDDESVFTRKKFRYGVDDRKNVGFGLWQLAYGSKDTLNTSNYASARAAMMAFENDAGDKLGITPTHLIVPASLESQGKAVVEKQNLSGGESNIWFNTAKLVVVPWLD
jgi:phage major head subunit gpT-like protein